MFTLSKAGFQQSRSLAAHSPLLRPDGWLDQVRPLNGGSLQGSARSGIDRGGNRLQTARSLRRYLQGLARPGTNRSLQDATGSTDLDYYRLFDKTSRPLTFQGNGSLLLGCNLINRSTAAISIEQLNKQGAGIPGSLATIQAGESFNYPNILSRGTFYLKVSSTALGQNRYALNLPIINS